MGAKADVLCTVQADADVLLQWVRADFLDDLMHLMPFLTPEVTSAEIQRMSPVSGLPVFGESWPCCFLHWRHVLGSVRSWVVRQHFFVLCSFSFAPSSAPHFKAIMQATLAVHDGFSFPTLCEYCVSIASYLRLPGKAA